MVVYQKNGWLLKSKYFFFFNAGAFIEPSFQTIPSKEHSADTAIRALEGLWEMLNLWFWGGNWWMGLWCVWCFVLFCMHFFFSLSASDRNSALPTFWRPPRKTEGSCILYFPWDLMKYTAPGLLSIWTFRLLSQYKGVLAVTNITWLGSPAARGFSCQLLT